MNRSMFRGFKTRALVLSVSTISAATTMSSASYAQDEQLEEIQITGSRIRTTNGMATPTPVTAITFTELQDIDPGGIISEQIGTLPQFFGTQSSQRGSGALFGEAGGSYLNMRSLGANRTLILLDGSRVVPGAKTGSVNVDTLPNALIRTVDVVTGGASAAYGADAVGGVTNFILDRQFQGLKINAGTGVSEWGDGERYNLSVAAGKQFGDRFNVIASVDSKFINQYERDAVDLDPDYYKRWGLVTNPAYRATDPPGTNPQRLTLPWVTSSYSSPYGVIGPGPGASAALTAQYNSAGLNRMKFLPDGSGITPFINGDVVALAGTQSMSGGPEAQIHNRAFDGDRGAEAISRSGFVGLRYDLTDNIELYGQALVGRSESNTEYRQSSYELGGLGSMTIFRDNAYLPASVAAAMDRATPPLTSIRVEKLGSFVGVPEIGFDQRDHNVLSTKSWSVGFNATLPNGWDLSGNWQTGESEKRSHIYDLTRVDRMYLSLDAVRHPVTGAIVCNVQLYNPTPAQLAASPAVAGRFTDVGDWEIAAGLRDPSQRVPLASPIGLDNTIRDCVPHNVMGNGNISQAAIDYIGTDKRGIGNVDQDFAELLLRGEVHEGWGYGPVSFAGGVNYREQSMTDGATPIDVEVLGPPLNDPALGIRGIASNYTGGSANLHAFSTVPLLKGEYDVTELFGELQAPIWESSSGNQSLGANMAFRQSDYSRTGKVDSWKLGVEFQVFEDLRVRATKSRDVREPTFAERLDAQGGGGTVTDSSRPADGSVSITTVSGGNPNLNPELANTNVVGFVYQPSWADGLSLSTDWYEVDINGAVGQLGAQRIVDECNAGSLELCPNIERETPTGGKIIRVFNYFLNVASQRVEGIDSEIAYRMEPDFFSNETESLSIRALAGYIRERSNIATPGAASIEFDGQTGTPNFTALITSTYSLGPMSFQLQMRHIDSVTLNNAPNTALWHSGVEVDDASIASNTWFNGQVGYNGELSNGSTWNVAFNVQNLFDRNPPTIPSFGNRGGSQTLSDNYDLEGRRYQLSLNYTF
jgi:iron complex outermembrane recepter protein